MGKKRGPAKNNQTSPREGQMKISDLSALSGIPVSTIKFYLRKGLLPKPVKTGETISYYTLQHLDRLKLIQKIQKEAKMPLDKLKEITRLMDLGEERGQRAQGPESADKRADIIQAVMPLFQEKGYDPVTIADIVEVAGIGRSTFYKNFKDKKDLFVGCIQRILFDEASNLEVEGIDDETDLVSVFERQALALMEVDSPWRDMISMLRAAAKSNPGEFADILDEAMRLKVDLYEKRIKGGIRQGLLRKVNPKVFAVMIVGIQEACSEYLFKGQLEETPETVFEEVKDIVLQGVLKR